MSSQPPLDIEEALDLVLAGVAHRSSNEKHADFGKMLLEEYFVKLRERHQSDDVTRGYLDNLLPCIAAAIRGFSVSRDIFETRWESLSHLKQHTIENANHLEFYSPFGEKGFWNKSSSVIASLGFGGVLLGIVKTWVTQSGILQVSAAALGIVSGLFLFDFGLRLYKECLIRRAEKDFPNTLDESWRKQALEQYKLILRKFLLSAIKVREQWYPHLQTMDGEKVFGKFDIPHIGFGEHAASQGSLLSSEKLFEKLDKIVERRMAFK